MAVVVPIDGEIELLKKMLIYTNDTESYTLRVYKNNYSPNSTSTLSDFTEANFTGYSEVVFNRSDWASPSIDDNGEALATTSIFTWVCGSIGNTVFGYYLLGTNSQIVLWAERFETTRVLGNSDVLNISPEFTLKSVN